jgi:hypothetical protein
MKLYADSGARPRDQHARTLAESAYRDPCPWHHPISLEAWFMPRVLELVYTASDISSFAGDCGYQGPPFRCDDTRRRLLRCELDAAFFHVYGVARADVDYIMDTFPIVSRDDQKRHAEYRTKRIILEVYDAMAKSIATATPYQTILDLPPADARVAHPATGSSPTSP